MWRCETSLAYQKIRHILALKRKTPTVLVGVLLVSVVFWFGVAVEDDVDGVGDVWVVFEDAVGGFGFFEDVFEESVDSEDADDVVGGDEVLYFFVGPD